MGLVLLEAPAAPVVSLEEPQVHLRSEHPEEAALVASLVAAATAQVEAFCRRRFVTQRWRATFARFPDGALLLPHPPLASVEDVICVDIGGGAQVLAPADYVVRTAETPGEVVPAFGKSWPATRDVPDAVAVDFSCGYGGPADIPDAVKRAVRLLVGTLFANRESVAPTAMQPVPHAAEWLLGPFVVRRFAA